MRITKTSEGVVITSIVSPFSSKNSTSYNASYLCTIFNNKSLLKAVA